MNDVIIIGAGVIGCAIAEELSRYNITITVIEKEADAARGVSCRNSGVVHSGIHYKPGSLRARLDVQGNALMPGLCTRLKVPFKPVGKLTVAMNDHECQQLERLREQGEANGVPGLRMLQRDEMVKMQPGIGGIRALHSPSTGIISPYGLTIALMDNAIANGAHFHFEEKVISLERDFNGFRVKTSSGKEFTSRLLVNAAGVHADLICAMLGISDYKIYPCRGEYYILDKRLKDSLKLLIYPVPHTSGAGLGIHLTNTVDGNILIGPSNEYIEGREDYASTAGIMELLRQEGHNLLPGLSTHDFIRNFSGIRPKQTPPETGGFADFVIEERTEHPGFFNLVGIESPGLTSAPAIARMVREMVLKHLPVELNRNFRAERPGFSAPFAELDHAVKSDLIAQCPAYGEVICRCEHVTRQEILDAIESIPGRITLSGIKYRTRAMMGRCQGGFCLPKIMNILQHEFGMRPEEIMLHGCDSAICAGNMRQDTNHAH